MPYVAANPESLDGTPSIGSGECVALVEKAAGAPHASAWTRGALVKGNTAIAAGTAIATFDASGKYANHRHGNHAAIYLSQDASGIKVIDQWNVRNPKTGAITRHIAPHVHVLAFDDKRSPSNNGNKFSVIQ